MLYILRNSLLIVHHLFPLPDPAINYCHSMSSHESMNAPSEPVQGPPTLDDWVMSDGGGNFPFLDIERNSVPGTEVEQKNIPYPLIKDSTIFVDEHDNRVSVHTTLNVSAKAASDEEPTLDDGATYDKGTEFMIYPKGTEGDKQKIVKRPFWIDTDQSGKSKIRYRAKTSAFNPSNCVSFSRHQIEARNALIDTQVRNDESRREMEKQLRRDRDSSEEE